MYFQGLSSVIARFVTIGTLLRRLEILLAILRTRSAHEGPTVHSYAHALSAIITFLRNALAVCPPTNDQSDSQHTLSAVWMQYGIYEEILLALSSLYEREEEKLPQDYPPFNSSPPPLLSRVYQHLNTHFERQSPRIVNAILAFILTNASHEYLQQVSRSIGYGLDPSRKPLRSDIENYDQYFLDEDDDNDSDVYEHQPLPAASGSLPVSASA